MPQTTDTKKTVPESFDFEKEVALLFRDFPQLKENTIFVNGDGDDPKTYTGSPATAQHPQLPFAMVEVIKRMREKTSSRAIHYEETLHIVLLIPKNAVLFGTPQINKAFHLYHETGHLLVLGGMSGRYPFRENAADAFAALRYLQRFGNNTQALSLLSAYRGYELLKEGGWEYSTSMMVNQIIKDSKHTNFKDLSPEDTLKSAQAYAQKYTPNAAEIAELKTAYNDTSDEAKSHIDREGSFKKGLVAYMASTALTTPSRFLFQIGVTVFQPFFNPSGAALAGEHMQFDRETRCRLREQFIKNARQFELYDLAAALEENKTDAIKKPSAPKRQPVSALTRSP